MKDYKFVTITEIGRGWFEVDGAKKRMKREEAIATYKWGGTGQWTDTVKEV